MSTTEIFDYREYPAPAYVRQTIAHLRDMMNTPHLTSAGRELFAAAIKDLEDYASILDKAYILALMKANGATK